MSAEETELTFVRCPSCKSLVPAVATRCRLCGHLFEEKGDANADSSKSKRVRQKSMWGSDQAAAEDHKSTEATIAVTPSAPEPQYDDSEMFEEPVPDFTDEELSFSAVEEVESEPVYVEPVPRENRDRGSRDRAAVEEKAETPPPPPRAKEQTRTPRNETTATRPKDYFENEEEDIEQTKEEAMESFQSRQRENGRASATRSIQPNNEDSALLGWFVNFNDDDRGLASEIREGRFIIGQERLRDSDMVVEDPSISTPHCIISASRLGGFRVQDLMSEQGTAVKKHNTDSWQTETGPLKLEHGDWLKLGDYEVMVCLIPFPKKQK